MKIIYKPIAILGFGLISLSVIAQNRQDTVLTRQVYLEREYNPTLNEATKINTAPNIYAPKTQFGQPVILNTPPQVDFVNNKLGKVTSGDIRTDVPFFKQRFYLKGGAGSHGNIEGTAGVRALDSKTDKLDVSAIYSGTNGNVDYAHPTDLIKKTKAKYSNLKADINYQHTFQPSVLSIRAGYKNMGYNYYGTPFGENSVLGDIDLESKQKVDIISFGAGLRSSDVNEGLLKYEAKIGYTNFSSKYGYLPLIEKGPKGGILEGDVNFYTALGGGNIGVAAGILNQSFSNKKDFLQGEILYHSLTNFSASPYYKIEDVSWNVNLGINVNYVSDVDSKFVVAPNITSQLHIDEVNTLYANITGGVNDNTYVEILNENRYASPLSRVAFSRTAFDINAGFKSGVVQNLEFEIFGGYKQVKDDHLFAALSLVDPVLKTRTWSNLGMPVYSNINTGHAGGLLRTTLIPLTTLSARLTGYFYNVNNYDKAWGRPSFTVDITADVKPIDRLTLSLQYIMQAGRKGLILTGVNDDLTTTVPAVEGLTKRVVNMKNVNELDIYAEFELLKWLSVYGRVNNLLNQKYEQQLGYTLQGLNFLGGVSLKF